MVVFFNILRLFSISNFEELILHEE